MMSNKSLYFCLLLICFLFACIDRDAKTSKNTSANDSSIDIQENRDSLYQHYMEAKSNDYSTKAILESGKLYPVDEAPLDSSFLIFRGQLLDIIRAKDFVRLMPLVDQNIKASFGDANGKEGFIQMWNLNDLNKINSSELWSTLESVLQQGGTFSSAGGRRSFTAPYTFSNWPDQYDAFEYMVVQGTGVRFRALPELNGKIITNLSHDIVKILDRNGPEQTIGGETHNWAQVESLDGEMGYVWGKFLQSPIDFRARFEEKAPGKWRMVFLVAGD